MYPKPIISIIFNPSPESWNTYVFSHPLATVSHHYNWKIIIEKTYNHQGFYLAAHEHENPTLTGILPLVHMNRGWGRGRLVSLPFLDEGGVLANDPQTEEALVAETLKLAARLKACYVELRQEAPLKCRIGPDPPASGICNGTPVSKQQISQRKVSLRMDLPETEDALLASFRSKLRNQITKAVKNRFTWKTGGPELLSPFYNVWSHNMRDLGSPAHSRRFFENMLDAFGDDACIAVVQRENRASAASLMLKFKNVLKNPWASSLKQDRRLNPNMLLYRTMLAHACNNGFNRFDFGRSSKDTGAFRFKRQWGARPAPLFWHYLFLDAACRNPEKEQISYDFWKKVPLPLSRLAGPCIRKHISL